VRSNEHAATVVTHKTQIHLLRNSTASPQQRALRIAHDFLSERANDIRISRATHLAMT
jgi:hypothetical protein